MSCSCVADSVGCVQAVKQVKRDGGRKSCGGVEVCVYDCVCVFVFLSVAPVSDR